MTMSKLLKRTRKCCLKIFQRLSIAPTTADHSASDCDIDAMGNNGSSKIKNKSTRPGGAGKSSKLAARIAPTFGRHQSVNYIPQKNHRTPTRTPTKRNDRVIPVPETINQQRFQRDVYRSGEDSTEHGGKEGEEEGGSIYYREGRRINLYGSRAATDSYEDYDEDFDQAMPSSTLTEGYFSARPTTTTTTNGLDKGRNWISTSGSADKNGPGDEIIDQWPCEIVDTDHPVIFVENRVYIGPSDKDEFKCFELGQYHHHHQQKQCDWDVAPPPYSHSTPKQKKRVLFEKVNYEKYRRVRSQHNYSGDDEDSPRHSPPDDVAGQQRCSEEYAMNKRTTHKHCFSNGEIDRDEYGHQWCQDLLNWSREAAEYQRRRHRNNQQNELMSSSPPRPPPLDSMDSSRSSGNWFHDKFRSSSASRYNKMSGTEDSGVVCQFDEDENEATDDDFWGRSKTGKNLSANDNDDVKHSQSVTMQQQKQQVEDGVDSWEVLKQKVFEPAESTITPSRIVRDSDGRLLGRRCSCNSMCTSLCTLETWVDDEIFDNNFNEELERRVGRVEFGISRD